jgi:hypothetical protein
LLNSLLSYSVQQYGKLDLVLRCMEDEIAPQVGKSEFQFQDQRLFSEIWVGGVYEVLRLLKERKLADSVEFRDLEHDFTLLRVTLDKHDIAGQASLKAPLEMFKDQTNVYLFRKNDLQRSHIMSIGVTPQGSVVWQTIDLKADAARWIERRALSDRMITLWGEQASLKAD